MTFQINGCTNKCLVMMFIVAFCQRSVIAIETPQQVADILSKESPQVAKLISKHPHIIASWNEAFWIEALLRSPKSAESEWRIHDFRRPQPNTLTPNFDECPLEEAPAESLVLFDGNSLEQFTGDAIQEWSIVGSSLTPASKVSNRLYTKRSFGKIHLHLEFKSPSPTGNWQYRGNSGIFLMGLYEVQILDSYNNPVYPDGMMGALYGQRPPLLNVSLPPERWQCLDIFFTPPRFVEGKLNKPAFITVRLNGITVQDQQYFLGPTTFANVRTYQPHKEKLPFSIQDHGDGHSQVQFRNIWVIEK